MINIEDLQEGQQVYIIYRNPHTQTVSTVQEASIERDPMNPDQLSLLLFDFYHPIEADDALFQSFEEAESMFEQFYM